jgi:DNA-binding response OmpR family regulator
MADTARILIVEDEPILALELKEDLQDLGFAVSDVVADGDMVLRSFLRDRPDIVLMDIRLQGFRDGIESAAQIRGFFSTPIIYLSSLPEKEVEHRLPRTAPYSYVQKPYELPRLKNALDLALQY